MRPAVIDTCEPGAKERDVQQFTTLRLDVCEHAAVAIARSSALKVQRNHAASHERLNECGRFFREWFRCFAALATFSGVDPPQPNARMRGLGELVGQVDVDGVAIDDTDDASGAAVIRGQIIVRRDKQPAAMVGINQYRKDRQ